MAPTNYPVSSDTLLESVEFQNSLQELSNTTESSNNKVTSNMMFYMNIINSLINYLSIVLILNVIYTLVKELRRKDKPKRELIKHRLYRLSIYFLSVMPM